MPAHILFTIGGACAAQYRGVATGAHLAVTRRRYHAARVNNVSPAATPASAPAWHGVRKHTHQWRRVGMVRGGMVGGACGAANQPIYVYRPRGRAVLRRTAPHRAVRGSAAERVQVENSRWKYARGKP